MARDTVCPAACGCAANLFHYPHSRVPLQLQSDRDSRADEGIASSHDIRDISVTKLTLPERLANGRHVDPQAGLFNGCARPRSMHEFFAGYDLARTLREIDQDIERSSPEGKHHSVARSILSLFESSKEPNLSFLSMPSWNAEPEHTWVVDKIRPHQSTYHMPSPRPSQPC